MMQTLDMDERPFSEIKKECDDNALLKQYFPDVTFHEHEKPLFIEFIKNMDDSTSALKQLQDETHRQQNRIKELEYQVSQYFDNLDQAIAANKKLTAKLERIKFFVNT